MNIKNAFAIIILICMSFSPFIASSQGSGDFCVYSGSYKRKCHTLGANNSEFNAGSRGKSSYLWGNGRENGNGDGNESGSGDGSWANGSSAGTGNGKSWAKPLTPDLAEPSDTTATAIINPVAATVQTEEENKACGMILCMGNLKKKVSSSCRGPIHAFFKIRKTHNGHFEPNLTQRARYRELRKCNSGKVSILSIVGIYGRLPHSPFIFY